MDLDFLFQRYFIALQMAEKASCDSSRITHCKLTDGYADRIAEARLGIAAGTGK